MTVQHCSHGHTEPRVMNLLWKVLATSRTLLEERQHSNMEPTARATRKLDALQKAVSDVDVLARRGVTDV